MSETIDISGLGKEELSSVVKSLKLYRTLKKRLGNRGVSIFNAIRTGEKTLRIEYFPSMGKEAAEKALADAFGKDFDKGFRTEWKENPSLEGGVRAFFGDEMVDLSFSRIERILG